MDKQSNHSVPIVPTTTRFQQFDPSSSPGDNPFGKFGIKSRAISIWQTESHIHTYPYKKNSMQQNKWWEINISEFFVFWWENISLFFLLNKNGGLYGCIMPPGLI